MPRSNHPATCLCVRALVASLAACSPGHVETHVPAGITYRCDDGTSLAIRFNGGGYQPESDVRAVANGAPSAIAVPRGGAEVEYGDRRLRMLPEYTERGLRYRSEARYDGEHYLVWTQRGEANDRPEHWARPGAPGGAEDVRLGRRASIDHDGDEAAEGEPVALCRRDGRSPAPAGSSGGHDPGEPHRR